MASIRKRGQRYHVQVRRIGFATRTKSFTKRSDATEWARLIEGQIDRQELAPCRKTLKDITLADLVTRYRDEVVPTKRGGDVETIVLNSFLRHSICRKVLSELRPSDFAAYRDERLKDRKADGSPKITAKSLKRQLAPVNNMFRHAAVEWEIPLRGNPMDGLKLRVVDQRRERRLRDGEGARLVTAAKKTRNRYVLPIILFAIETAMRRGEILSLRWRDIDLERGSATILETKNGYKRVIPLTDDAMSILTTIRPDDAKPIDLAFPITPVALRQSWDRLTERAKLQDLHFHDLRHEAVSRLFELGLTVPEVASISGHRTLAQLMRYSHANQDTVRAKLSGGSRTKLTGGQEITRIDAPPRRELTD
ncbi:integrase [Mesorhizobium amorphae]|uniref:Shufflon-specific DNA recombinase n=1 Tax=Mesorhizobium amorphae CCNWGS0123 TaxID=1082933 RepID=G6Y2F4_9HYPH|nr:site-specific integrase [Mesorhizobium amorphae]ANT53448.1 integrase [Mesorhizobium amorphae CCNWGS0123]EHH14137.1 shufflon-specific DNA recombinase [Mesorhizobium amorphae CCNWGS0123]GLR41371.1 integrase [Mesorhizobium amorphae]